MTDTRLLTVVIPVFNEEDNIEPLYQRLSDVIDRTSDRYEFEILFTDNHSTDATFETISRLAENDDRIRCLRFSRNFGFQRSILTGYRAARGAAAIQIDADLQDPPELINEFIAQWEAGYDVVYGVRRNRKEGKVITLARRIFYWTINKLSTDDLPQDAGDFRLVDAKILDALREIDDYHPYLRGLIASFGFEQTGVPYDRGARTHGDSKFSLGKLAGLAMDGILLHSVVPLRVATGVAFLMSLFMLIGIGVYLFARLILNQDWPAGFATLAILTMVGITLNAVFLGVIGEYLGRMYQQIKKRPLTLVEQEIPNPAHRPPSSR